MPTTAVREVKRKVNHPVTGAEITRVAKVTHPVLFAENGNNKQVASIEEILAFAGSEENLAKIVQSAINAKVGYLARLELGGAEEAQKQLNRAIKNLKVVFPQMGNDEIRTMLMGMPGAKEKFEAVEVPAVLELTYGAAEILGTEDEAEETPNS
jgi:hypothetical protein